MKIALPLAALALLVALPGCVDRQKQAESKATEKFTSDPTSVVSFVPATSKTLQETVEITGAIAAGEDVQVGARQAGRLAAVYVKEGDRVSAGQTIATVETQTLQASVRQAEAGVTSARSALSQARNNAALQPARSASAVASARQTVAQTLAGVSSARAGLRRTLAGVRTEERRQAQAVLASAKSNLELQKKQLDRIRNLVTAGALAGQQLDIQQVQFDTAQAQYRQAQETVRIQETGNRREDIDQARQAVAQAEAQYRAAQEGVRSAQATQRLDVTFQDQVATAKAGVAQAEAGLAIARRNLSDAAVVAPFAGVVNGRPLQAGTVVSPGVAVVRLVGEGGAYFEGSVPDALVDRVAEGQAVAVTLSPSNEKFTGRVAAVASAGDAVARQFTARVVVEGDQRKLRPGLFARGRVVLQTIPNATVVPSGAIVRVSDKPVVFVEQGGKAKAVPVTLGLRVGEDQQVTGVEPGAKVVAKGASTLRDGTKIRAETPAPTTPSTPAPNAAGGA